MNKQLTIASLLLAAGGLILSPAALADKKYRDYDRGDRYERSHDYSRDRVHARGFERGHRRGFEPGHDRGYHRGHDRGYAHGYHDARRDMHKHRKLKHYYQEHRRHQPRWHHGHPRTIERVIVAPPRGHYGHHHHHSAFSTLAGGVIGGMVGNAVGEGDPVATTMGAMMGAVVGNRMGHR